MSSSFRSARAWSKAEGAQNVHMPLLSLQVYSNTHIVSPNQAGVAHKLTLQKGRSIPKRDVN
jgi:hypothetical protein